MKGIKVITLVLLLMLQLNACKQSEPITKIDFDQNLKSLGIDKNSSNANQRIDLCKVINVDWDLIWIIPPYTTAASLKAIDAENFSEIEDKVLAASGADWFQQLVVVKQNKVVAYGEIALLPLDLTKARKSEGSLVSIRKQDCAHTTGLAK